MLCMSGGGAPRRHVWRPFERRCSVNSTLNLTQRSIKAPNRPPPSPWPRRSAAIADTSSMVSLAASCLLIAALATGFAHGRTLQQASETGGERDLRFSASCLTFATRLGSDDTQQAEAPAPDMPRARQLWPPRGAASAKSQHVHACPGRAWPCRAASPFNLPSLECRLPRLLPPSLPGLGQTSLVTCDAAWVVACRPVCHACTQRGTSQQRAAHLHNCCNLTDSSCAALHSLPAASGPLHRDQNAKQHHHRHGISGYSLVCKREVLRAAVALPCLPCHMLPGHGLAMKPTTTGCRAPHLLLCAASDEACASLCNEDKKCEFWTW